ncbi:MAG: GNAT family N-acetyltransferase [Actinomycetes bacterium]
MDVRLRAVTADDVELLDAWRADPESRGAFNDFGVLLPSTLAEQLEQGTVVGADGGLLVVEADGVAVGSVGWHAVPYGPNPESRCFNLGIALAPHARGRGVGSRAQRMLADYLFATTTVNRVEASTDLDNIAEQRALEKGGFAREGVIRGAQFRAGSWRDLVGYSRLRHDG